MAVVKAALLLLMLAVLGTRAAPVQEACPNLNKTLTKADLQRVEGDWVLVWLNADANTTFDGWKKIKSSLVHNRVRSGVIDFTERNMLSGNFCMTFNTKMTASSEDQDLFSYSSGRVEETGAIIQFQDNATVKFYETCDDCLSMEYFGYLGHLLFIYTRDGLPRDAQVHEAASSEGRKLAECLDFPLDDAFTYDGVSDLCRKKSVSEECQTLTKTLTKADLPKVEGDWVQLWSSSVNETEPEWHNLTSTYVQISLDGNVITFREENRFLDNSCAYFSYNMSVTFEDQQFSVTSSTAERNGVETPESDSSKVSFYQSCDSCLSIEYGGNKGRVLLIYRRPGLHQETEVLKAASSEGQKLAECLDFPHGYLFTYDGVSEFCRKTSSPEVKTEEA